MSAHTNSTQNAFESTPPYKVACIGAGKMLTALINGMIHQGYDPRSIMATRRDQAALQHLSEHLAIGTSTDNYAAASWADVIILGLKPAQFSAVLPGLADVCQSKLLISLMAGVNLDMLKSSLTQGIQHPNKQYGCNEENQWNDWSVIRAMPNLPCQLSQGVTGLYADASVSIEQRNWATQLFATLGVVLWLSDETNMHSLTVISGCGPAYFFLLQEYLIDFALQHGFNQHEAELLVKHSAIGSVQMSMESEPQKLRAMISSPGGVTEKVIHSLEQHQLKQIWQEALSAGYLHSQHMAKRF